LDRQTDRFRIYDDRAWEEAGGHVPDQIKEVLRFCLQRPSNCGLLGRDEIDAGTLVGSSIETKRSAESGQTKFKGAVKRCVEAKLRKKALDQRCVIQYPLRLPWGGCILKEEDDRFVLEVPGVYRMGDEFGEPEWVFTT
jgi:hypothetical protein